MTARAAAALALAWMAAACGGSTPAPPPPAPAAGAAPSGYEAARTRFLAAYLERDWATAEAEARAAIAAEPATREGYMLLSKTFIDSGRDPEAVVAFTEIVQRDPRRAEPWFFRGFHEARLRRWVEAKESLERAVALAPADAEARFRLGLVLQAMDAAPAAILQLERAVELDPGSAGKSAALMTALETAGQRDRAEVVARRLLETSAGSADAHYAVAKLRLAQKRRVEAEAALRRALELSPDLAPARRDLEALLRTGGAATP